MPCLLDAWLGSSSSFFSTRRVSRGGGAVRGAGVAAGRRGNWASAGVLLPRIARARSAVRAGRSILKGRAMLFGRVFFKLTIQSFQGGKSRTESFAECRVEAIAIRHGLEENA